MKFIANDKDFKIIGFPQSLLAQDAVQVSRQFIKSDISIITPEEFIAIQDKDRYQYFPGFGLDLAERRQILDILDDENLDVVSYIHGTAEIHESAKIGRGVAIANFTTVMQNVVIGDHCIIESYCLLAHETSFGSNCYIHAGSMIAGRTKVGNNCLFNFKSSALNRVEICDDVVIGAGSMVTKNITTPGTYVGTIARKIR